MWKQTRRGQARQAADLGNTDCMLPTYRGVERGARSRSGESVAVMVVVRARDARQMLETDCSYFGGGRNGASDLRTPLGNFQAGDQTCNKLKRPDESVLPGGRWRRLVDYFEI